MNLFIPYHLNFFECTCYVHNLCPGLDKLSARSHKCFFLGFTRSKKGYKCFSLSLNRYFIYANVTFTKSSLYFKSLSSPPVFVSGQVHILVVFDPSVMSSVPEDSPPPPPLQVYNRHQSSHCPHDDSLLMPDRPSLMASIVELDIPIASIKVYVLPVISLHIIML